MSSDPAPTRQETVTAFLAVAARRSAAVPLRTTFAQQGERAKPRPGPLRTFVRSHDENALDLFLLHRARASSPPWDVAADARVWARSLGLATPRDPGAAAVSKIWTRLDEKYGLVKRERSGRLLRVSSLREDGSRHPYEYPAGNRSGERYLKLPFAYWTEDWYRTLGLPAKAMLLVALSLRSPFVLPSERVPDWYGVRTFLRGLVLPGERRMHFQAERDARRRELLARLVSADPRVRVYESMGPAEAARAASLVRLTEDLVKLGARRLVLESRGQTADRRDRQVIASVLGPDAWSTDFAYQHLQPHEDPALWISDAVAWCYGAGGEWRRRVQPLLEDVIQVQPMRR